MKLLKRTLIMVVLLAAFISNATGVMDFCRQCQIDCANSATEEWSRCLNNGGSFDACSKSSNDYENNCISLCNYAGCKIPYNTVP